MTDPKNTEDQELSLDQLKDAAGGATGTEYGLLAAMVAVGPIGGCSIAITDNKSNESFDPKENLEPEAGDDVLKKNADSLRSDNRF